MVIKQLSVFLENKKGRLCAVVDLLAEHGVNIRALSLADTAEFGILRLIVDRPEDSRAILTESGVIVSVTDVIAVTMPDVPGGTRETLHLLSDRGINIEYMYACVGQKSGKALMVMQVDDKENAQKALTENGLDEVNFSDIYQS